ncbi:unnamed protein product [Notodromas monacha]|uniref:NSUN5/RCM1 N-terminal domain-containing protein n=1 Tax=Notodromas monacha TaxID=399045 RepID=A0A7R9BJU7_9CRUS|nr:unnamed protein product [Notodromas monacha]CAG0915299.1 unnamed protein product [Notodromas monacha]
MAEEPGRVKIVRTPRLYRCAANVFRGVIGRDASLKALIHSVKHPNKRGIQGLVCKTLQHSSELDHILEGTDFLSKAKVDENLGKVLIAELLWGKGFVQGDSSAVKAVPAGRVQALKRNLRPILRRNKAHFETVGEMENQVDTRGQPAVPVNNPSSVLAGLAWYSFLMMTMPLGVFVGIRRVGDDFNLFGDSKFHSYACAAIGAVLTVYLVIAKYVHRAYVEDSQESVADAGGDVGRSPEASQTLAPAHKKED